MSEMLGNRYFIARQFDKAIPQLELALQSSPFNDKIKKKLIICHAQSGNIDRSLSLFYEIIKKDPNIIINTDPYHDDCPCLELIPSWENKANIGTNETGCYEILGILYLYCDLNISITYFRKALEHTEHIKLIASIIKILSELEAIEH